MRELALLHRLNRRRFLGGTSGLVLAGAATGFNRGTSLAKPEHEGQGAGFWARPSGAKGDLIGYSLTTGEALFTLPPGQLAADGTRYLSAEAMDATGDTWLNVYDPLTGQLRFGWLYDGDWTLGGISASGRYVALSSVPTSGQRSLWTKQGGWQTDLIVVDLDAGPTPHRFTLRGNFEVEVLSARGDALFLVEHLPAAAPDHYIIRYYDLILNELSGRLVDKRAVDEVMAGLAWDFVASPDGAWLLTLYLSTNREVAFVHTLNLVNRFPVCVDLPSGFGEFDLLKHYTLALTPDNRRLFAANPALGAIAVIDLDQTKVVDVATFEPATGQALAAADRRSRSAVGAGGRFFFTGGEDVWTYDAAADRVGAALAVPGPIIGLGLAPDERHVLVARPDAPLLALDAATGTVAGFPIASA